MSHFATGSLVEWKIPGEKGATGLVLNFEKHMLGSGAWVMWSDRDEPMWALLRSLVPRDLDK
jgi:hypothetical protein